MESTRVFAEHRPFEPEAAEAMRAAFDAAWQSLVVRNSELTSPAFREGTREQLALRIIETAQTGERDVNRLRDDAVEYVLTIGDVAKTRSLPTVSLADPLLFVDIGQAVPARSDLKAPPADPS